MAIADLSWMDRSACLDLDADLFFKPGDRSGKTRVNEERKRAAKRVCERECPVRQECLVDALRSEDHHGIRGGYTERERRKMVKVYRQSKAERAAQTAPA